MRKEEKDTPTSTKRQMMRKDEDELKGMNKRIPERIEP